MGTVTIFSLTMSLTTHRDRKIRETSKSIHEGWDLNSEDRRLGLLSNSRYKLFSDYANTMGEPLGLNYTEMEVNKSRIFPIPACSNKNYMHWIMFMCNPVICTELCSCAILITLLCSISSEFQECLSQLVPIFLASSWIEYINITASTTPTICIHIPSRPVACRFS